MLGMTFRHSLRSQACGSNSSKPAHLQYGFKASRLPGVGRVVLVQWRAARGIDDALGRVRL